MKFKSGRLACFMAIVFAGLLLFCSGYDCGKSSNPQYPSDMRFIMYCEQCAECGYMDKEIEYSIISNDGYSDCKNCGSHYEFTLDDNGNKQIKGE